MYDDTKSSKDHEVKNKHIINFFKMYFANDCLLRELECFNKRYLVWTYYLVNDYLSIKNESDVLDSIVIPQTNQFN